jgi:hypothetical protein
LPAPTERELIELVDGAGLTPAGAASAVGNSAVEIEIIAAAPVRGLHPDFPGRPRTAHGCIRDITLLITPGILGRITATRFVATVNTTLTRSFPKLLAAIRPSFLSSPGST